MKKDRKLFDFLGKKRILQYSAFGRKKDFGTRGGSVLVGGRGKERRRKGGGIDFFITGSKWEKDMPAARQPRKRGEKGERYLDRHKHRRHRLRKRKKGRRGKGVSVPPECREASYLGSELTDPGGKGTHRLKTQHLRVHTSTIGGDGRVGGFARKGKRKGAHHLRPQSPRGMKRSDSPARKRKDRSGPLRTEAAM